MRSGRPVYSDPFTPFTQIDNLITLDTPVYNWHSPLSFPPGDVPLNKSKIGEWFDVMVTPDAVAPADSQLSTRWPATISVLVVNAHLK